MLWKILSTVREPQSGKLKALFDAYFLYTNCSNLIKDTQFEALQNKINIFDEFVFVMHASSGFSLNKINWCLE